MFESESVARKRILIVAIPVVCFFLILLSWNTLGATGNKIPKLPSFNWEQMKKGPLDLRGACWLSESATFLPACPAVSQSRRD